MKFDILKILIVPAILISVFFMSRYESYGGKGDFIINDNSYILQKETKSEIEDQITNDKNKNICDKSCAKDCTISQANETIDVIKCLDACACNDEEFVSDDNSRTTSKEINVITSTKTFNEFGINYYGNLKAASVIICILLILFGIVKTEKQIIKCFRIISDFIHNKIGYKKNIKFDYIDKDDQLVEEEAFNYKKITDI